MPKKKPYVPPMPAHPPKPNPAHMPGKVVGMAQLAEGSSGWMAPPNAALECEQEMESITRELMQQLAHAAHHAIVRFAHVLGAVDLAAERERLFKLCGEYEIEHAKFNGGHRADGWTRPDGRPKVPRTFRLKYGDGVALTVEAHDEKSAIEKGRAWVVSMDPSEVIDLGVKL